MHLYASLDFGELESPGSTEKVCYAASDEGQDCLNFTMCCTDCCCFYKVKQRLCSTAETNETFILFKIKYRLYNVHSPAHLGLASELQTPGHN